jgi:hypothetical protein
MKWTWILLISISTFAQEAKKAEAPVLKTPPKTEVVSEAAAQAGTHVVTSREVQISYALDQALATPLKKMTDAEKKIWWTEPKADSYTKALAQVLLELVVQMEAENFSIGQASPEDMQNLEKHAQEHLKGWKPWQELEVSQLELQQMLMRKLRAKNFLKFKTDSSGVQISDEEAKKYYEKNRVKFGNLPFSQFKDNIKQVLAQEQLQDKLKDWFEILKRKYRVHYLGQSG